jgi:hypothetical protein
MTHVLKTWPQYFSRILSHEKTFEVRQNDRDFQAGDFLDLREWCPETKEFTGHTALVTVSYVLHGGQFGIEAGYCVLGLKF